jgi:hypothetical protein
MPPANELSAEMTAPTTAVVGADEGAPTLMPDADQSAEEPNPRWWGKYVVWVGAIAVVVIIVSIIRLFAPGSTSPGSLTPVTVKSDTHAALIPVSSTVLSQFTAASNRLNAANVTITHALDGSTGQSVAQVTQEVTPYVTALTEFAYTAHGITWPQAMQVPAQDLFLRTQAFISFLQSISFESAGSLNTWFAQLHALASQTQTADNLVRKDVGLATTSSYTS